MPKAPATGKTSVTLGAVLSTGALLAHCLLDLAERVGGFKLPRIQSPGRWAKRGKWGQNLSGPLPL
jgi:hypothetical protein